MNCERELEVLSYFYNELTEADKADLERHLHECASCRDYLNELVVVTKPVRLDEPLPEELRGYSEKASRMILRERHATSAKRLWLSAAASIAVVLFCGLFAFNLNNGSWNDTKIILTPTASQPFGNSETELALKSAEDVFAEAMLDDNLGSLDTDINYLISDKD